MVAAIMGAKARPGHMGGGHEDDDKADKQAAEEKKQTTTTADPFDEQVAAKLGTCFDDVSPPAIRKRAEAGLSYDEVKRLVKLRTTWGAKLSGQQSRERVAGHDDRRRA